MLHFRHPKGEMTLDDFPDGDNVTFATREWLRLFATYASIHMVIRALSKLKGILRNEQVPSPDSTTRARGGSTHDRQADGFANGWSNGNLYGDGDRNVGTYDVFRDHFVPRAPVHPRRTQSFGLCPDELAENVVYPVDPIEPMPGRGDDEASDPEDTTSDEDDQYGGHGVDGHDTRVSNPSTTKKQLRALYRTEEFKAWCVRKKLDSESLQAIYQRMHLYRKLREIHPESFWALCSPESLNGIDVMEVGALGSAAEYVCSRFVDLAVAYVVYRLRADFFAIIISYAFVVRHWAKGRSSCGWMFNTWYARVEEEALSVGLFRSALANILEDLFVVGTFGVGALVSLKGLLFASQGEIRPSTGAMSSAKPLHRQSTGERVVGVSVLRQVKESRKQQSGK